MTCDICGVRDSLAKMSSFNLFCLKIWHFLRCIDKLGVAKEFNAELWKTNLNKFAKVILGSRNIIC